MQSRLFFINFNGHVTVYPDIADGGVNRYPGKYQFYLGGALSPNMTIWRCPHNGVF